MNNLIEEITFAVQAVKPPTSKVVGNSAGREDTVHPG